MEAVEGAVAEAPAGERRRAAAVELDRAGEIWLDPVRWLPHGTVFDTEQQVTWLAGSDLQTGTRRWVPLDIIDMDGECSELSGVCKTTHGLASLEVNSMLAEQGRDAFAEVVLRAPIAAHRPPG